MDHNEKAAPIEPRDPVAYPRYPKRPERTRRPMLIAKEPYQTEPAPTPQPVAAS